MAAKRGNAQALVKYWSKGSKGGQALRWGAKGAFTRCTSAMRQYLGPRAEGYCARLHRRNTGRWPGRKR